MTDDQKEIVSHFKQAVNMTSSQMEKWLDTDESNSVGQKTSEGAESTGHHSGKRIAQILEKKPTDYTEGDFAQMQRVNSDVARHLAQRPGGDIERAPWRYSLMNWGHDPQKT